YWGGLFSRCTARFASSAFASRLARSPPPCATRLSLRARERISSKFSSGPPKGSRSQPIRILPQLALTTSMPLGSCAHTTAAHSNTKKSKPRIFTAEDPWLLQLEHITYADNNTTIAAVCPPLIQEVS